MKKIHSPFIKTTKKELFNFTSEQKVLLNRRGNEFFNAGKIKQAQEIFRATGYSDGLTRVGDYYIKNNQYLEALKFYCLAKNKRKSDPLIESLVSAMKIVLNNDSL